MLALHERIGLTPRTLDRKQREQVLDSLTRELAEERGFELQSRLRLRRVIQMVLTFYEALLDWRILNIFGPQLARDLVHAVFGGDLGTNLFDEHPYLRRILILGETGVGKGIIASVMAEALRQFSTDQAKVVSLNAAALPTELLESELFGYERGAHSQAILAREGLIAEVDGGVLFLDEVANASLHVQAKLLQVLQTGEYRKLGGHQAQHASFHLISATNHHEADLRTGKNFRADLYYRLSGSVLVVPPFRDLISAGHPVRQIFESIADHVMSERLGRTENELSRAYRSWFDQWWQDQGAPTVLHRMAGYHWPGNLRECSHFLAELINNGGRYLEEVCAKYYPEGKTGRGAAVRSGTQAWPQNLKQTLEGVECSRYQAAARDASSVEQLARRLGVSRQTASRRLRHFGLILGQNPAAMPTSSGGSSEKALDTASDAE